AAVGRPAPGARSAAQAGSFAIATAAALAAAVLFAVAATAGPLAAVAAVVAPAAAVVPAAAVAPTASLWMRTLTAHRRPAKIAQLGLSDLPADVRHDRFARELDSPRRRARDTTAGSDSGRPSKPAVKTRRPVSRAWGH